MAYFSQNKYLAVRTHKIVLPHTCQLGDHRCLGLGSNLGLEGTGGCGLGWSWDDEGLGGVVSVELPRLLVAHLLIDSVASMLVVQAWGWVGGRQPIAYMLLYIHACTINYIVYKTVNVSL